MIYPLRSVLIILFGGYLITLFFAFAKINSDYTLKTNNNFTNTVIPEDCATLINPIPNATNVPVDTQISWMPENGFGYTISIGTTSGDTDILLTGAAFGSELITPPLGLPENSDIFVDIVVRVDESDPSANIDCDVQQFRTGFITQLPDCTTINNPPDGAMNVILNPTFSWEYAPRANSYRLIVTEDASNTVVFNQNVGNTLTFTLTGGDQLAQNTTYRAVIIPVVNAQMVSGEAAGCSEIIFTTADVDTTPPDCTVLESPDSGSTNVVFSPILSWAPVEGADGYFVTIASNTGILVLDQGEFIGQNTTSTPVIGFDPNTEYCVVIQPFRTITAFDPPINVAAIDCEEICFSTSLGCGPIEDPDTGEMIDLNPKFDSLEENYTFCLDQQTLSLEFEGNGTQFNWIRLNEDGNGGASISTDRTVFITESGNYRLEVIDEIIADGGSFFCEAQFDFEVSTSEAPTITQIDIFNQTTNTSQVVVNVVGSGDYEYAIGNSNGPYQDSNIFNNVSFLDAIVFVRDRNGCGTAQQSFARRLGFPAFFTPNQDGFNDFWQVKGIVVDGQTVTRIQIFDRFGKRLADFDPLGRGWDGTYNGQELPSGGFWYRAFTQSDFEFKGFFVLKR